MANSVKLALKATMILGALFFLFVVVFVAKTIFDAPLNIFDDIATTADDYSQEKIVLLRGSGARLNQLENYFLFSNGKNQLEDWLEQNKKDVRKLNNKSVYIENDLKIPAPLKNDCPIVYCFQSRLRFENIPPIFWKGLIGIEDERFLSHQGIDFKSLLRAFIHDLKVMRLEQGGSTLTQQIVKNLFYSNEKKFSRKFKEMILAVYLESQYEKERILEAYFNEVIWGGKQGIKIKGLYAASLFYFSKKPDRISPYEAAILIALLKGPNFYNPLTREKRLRDRANLVYKKLVNMNLFPPEADENWDDRKWSTWINKLKNSQKGKPFRNNWWLSKNLEKGELGIYERYVLHSEIQKILTGINTKLEGRDIAVKAYFGDINKEDSTYFYYSKYERNWEKAKSEEKHILGSTIKPLIYSILVDLGSSMETEVETGTLELNLKSGVWKPREAHVIPEKFVTLNKALKLSYNRPLIREVISQSFHSVEEEMVKLFPDMKTPLAEYPAQLLGTVEVSLEQLYTIYKKFLIKECKKDEDESIAKILSNPKETTVRKLVGKEFGGLKFFHKTGTSNNGFDNWFIFYEGRRLGVIWVGLEGRREGKDLKLYGGTTSFRIFKNFYLFSGRRFGELECGEPLVTN